MTFSEVYKEMNAEALLDNRCSLTHPICQQTMKGCHPTLDHRPRWFYLICGIFFIIVAAALFGAGTQVYEIKVRYDDKCSTGQTINVPIKIEKEISGPNYFYYELHGFYQNHFRFVKSVDKDQFHGRYTIEPEECLPIVKSAQGATLAPCGLAPYYFFNDYYEIENGNFSEDGINWPGEIGNLFEPINDNYNGGGSRWMLEGSHARNFPGELQNPHFVAWMRTSTSSNFKKLYARTDSTISAGTTINVKVTCDFSKDIFKGERYLSIVHPGYFGSRNTTMAITSVVLAVFSFIGFAIFMAKKPPMSEKNDVEVAVTP